MAFLAVFAGILFAAEWFLFRIDIQKDGQSKAESIRKTIISYQSETEKMSERFYEKLNDNVKLSAVILKDFIHDGEYTGQKIFDDGMVIQVRDGQTELPPGGDAIFPNLQPEEFMTEYTPKQVTTADGRDVLITSGMISDELYYLDWTDIEEYQEFFDLQIDAPQLLNFMADAYGGEIFLVSGTEPTGEILLKTDETEVFSNIADPGFRQKQRESVNFPLNTQTDNYMCYKAPLDDGEWTVIYCDTVTDEVHTGIHRALTKILFAGCFFAAMLVFCFAVQGGIKDGTITEKKAAGYSPEKMKKKILFFSLLSGLALMFVTIFTTFVQESHHENRKGISILDSLELQLTESDYRSEMAKQIEIDWYQYFGEKIAANITDHPQVLEKDMLARIAQIIHADLIIAFDETGNETGCSSDYIGFTLKEDENNQDKSDFQRLLKGIPAVFRGPEPDFITGQEHYVIGVPYHLTGRAGYGALLLVVSPSSIVVRDEDAAIGQIYSNLATDEELIMEIDPESFEILSTSGPRMPRSKMVDLDVNDQNRQENRLDIFAHDNVLYYGISRTIRDRIWYYAEEISGIVISAVVYSVVTGLIFILFCLITGRYAMKDYTPEFYGECLSANRLADNTAGKAIEEKTSYKAELLRQWQQLSPKGKTTTFLQVGCGIIVLILLVMGFLSGYAALSFYVTGSWQRGINPFAITAIVVIICVSRLFLIVMDLIFTMITLEMSAKEKTVAQLIRSIVRSVVIIGLLYNCLAYLGVNTSTLLASVGVLSLALSLGAKDLVSDTLAGLGIVFEGAFQTGEIVEIGGFKGFVEEIGIRTTKIHSPGSDNIKIINNSEIHNVINYSRELSKFRVYADLPVFLPIDMVTGYLEKELPVIGKEIPGIITGPEFAGITELDRNHMKIMIAGQCLEKDQLKITVDMNMKIKERIDQLIDLKTK